MTREREEFLINKVKKDWRYLGEISEEEQTDSVIDAAIDKSAWAFHWIKDKNKKTYDRCLRAVRRSGELLEFVPAEMQTDEIIFEAIRSNILAVRWIKDEKKMYKMCLLVVRYRGWLLRDVPDRMQTDEIIDLAMEDYPWVFGYIKDESKKTYERCLRAVKYSFRMLYYVPVELKERVKEEVENG